MSCHSHAEPPIVTVLDSHAECAEGGDGVALEEDTLDMLLILHH